VKAILAKKVLIYAIFVVAHGLSVLFAFIGCAVLFGQQLVSLLNASSLTYPLVVLQLYSLSIPLLLVFSLNILWQARSYGSITLASQRVILTFVVGITLPLLFFAMLMFLLPPARITSSGLLIYLLILALFSSFSLFVFLIIITSLAAEKPSQFARGILSDSKFWVIFILSLVLLFLSLYPVIEAQTLEGLLPQTYDETFRRSIVSGLLAFPVALVLPLFPWVFEYFGSRHSAR
jgi:hypothetical protein